MTNRKYYTPKMEEFCIGFEYESLQDGRYPESDTSWSKEKIDYEDIELFYKYYKENCSTDYRVKCLNEEHITELGWVQMPGSSTFEFKEFQLVVHNYNYIEIYGFDSNYVFRGRCKNKNQLLNLMLQFVHENI